MPNCKRSKTPSRKSTPSASAGKSSPKAARRKSDSTSEDADYEAERIIDHVTFEHAYREFFVNKDTRYENIFTHWVENNRIEHDKYYYLIKWKNWPEKDTTWECEENCSSMGYLKVYKKFNGLPKKCIRIRGAPCTEIPGKLIVKEYEKKEEANDSKLEPYGFYPDYKTYNAVYGMVRNGDVKRIKLLKETKEVTISIVSNKHQKFVLVERDMQYVLKCNVPKADSRNFEKWQQEVQTKDKSYLASIIQHPNSVKMLDYYFKCKNPHSGKHAVYCYTYECFNDDVGKKITAEEMTTENSKKMCADMLSILSLLHTYGVHHNISKNHIYVDGNVYKLSHFENFRLFTDTISMDESDETTFYYSIVYRPIEPYGSSLDEYKETFDIYALGIVLLESLTNQSLRDDVDYLEGDIDDCLEILCEPDRSMVSMMLNSREYIHEKQIPNYRFTAKSLLQHPWLYSNNFKHVKCVFLASYYSQPIEEILFYEDDDVVRTVVDRLTCLYFDPANIQFQMLFIKHLETGNEWVHYIEDGDMFVEKLGEFHDLKLVIVPILKANYEEPVRHRSISFVNFPPEFGSVPIVIESAPMSDMDVCKTVIEQAFPKEQRGLPFIIARSIPKHGRLTMEYEMCPSSFINDSLKHTFPQSLDGDDYAIPARPRQYCITRKEHADLKKIQPKTSANVDDYHICEFSMSFGEMSEPRECRFEPFASGIMEIERFFNA